MDLGDSDDRTEQSAPAPKAGLAGYLMMGCLGLVVLGFLAGVGGYFYMRHLAAGMNEMIDDPGLRAQFTQKVLGTKSFPPGLFPAVALKVPGMMDVVLLGDQLPNADGTPNIAHMKRGLLFSRIHVKNEAAALRDYYEGRSNEKPPSRVNIDTGKLLSTGKFERDGTEVLYRISRSPPPKFRHENPATISLEFYPVCADGMPRLGVWFVRDPNPGGSLTGPQAAGTPFDEESSAALLESISLCAPLG